MRTTSQGGDAMDLSRQHGPISLTEKKRRYDNNLCLYCGEAGHIAAGYPRKALRIFEVEAEEDPGKE